MTDEKPWYLSRTIWAALVTILASAAGLAGVTVGAGDTAALTEALLQAVTAVAGLVAIAGRLKANTKIR